LTIQVPEQALARLKAIGARTGQSTSELLGEALAAYLEHQEWMDGAIAEAVADSRAGEATIEHEKVVAWLRSWGSENELPPPQ
jgi:RHH-type transcriptional regulator, rel operon repressor / antitoxin RelB